MNDALLEAFQNTPEEPVIKFVHMGLRNLRDAANRIREERGIEVIEDYEE